MAIVLILSIFFTSSEAFRSYMTPAASSLTSKAAFEALMASMAALLTVLCPSRPFFNVRGRVLLMVLSMNS